MSCIDFKLLDYNYLFESGTVLTASSSNVNFPVSNLIRFHRSKMWRSSGNYVIDATNNKLNFNIGGSELTATLTSGSYTPTTLAAEVESKLESVSGSATFTVNYSTTTGKWTIAKASGTLNLLFSTGTNAATSCRSVLGMGVNDYTGALTYTGALISIHTEEYILIDTSTAEEFDSFACIFDPTLGINLTPSAVVRFQANATNSWASPAIDELLTIDDDTEVLSKYWVTAESYRYKRLKIVDPTNPDLYVQISKIYLGKSIDLTRLPSVGFSLSFGDRSKVIENDFGNRYTDEYPVQASIALNLDLMSKDDSNAIQQSFKRVGIRKPVLIVLDSTDLLFDRDKVTVYGHYEQSLGLQHVVRDLMSTQIVVKETF